MTSHLHVPARDLPVLAQADVLVCGGGPAGIAAACSAARHGCEVILLERWPSVGGMLTNALVNIWHTSDREKQVIYGVAQEAIERGGEFVARYDHYPQNCETHLLDSEGMRVVFQEMLDERGVRTICNLTAVESVVEDGRIRGVLVDTKTGRKAVLGRIVLDTTGDGDVAAGAGLPFEFGRAEDGRVQGMTMMYNMRGIDPQRAKQSEKAPEVIEKMRRMRDAGEFPPFNEGATKFLLPGAPNYVPWNMAPVAGNPLDEDELTRLTHRARAQVYTYWRLWRREMPGYEDAWVNQMGFGLGVRESRRVRGIKTLTREMVVGAVKQPDAVGHGFWIIDIHDPKGSGYTTWHDRGEDIRPPVGESYHIPLGMCINQTIPNLGVAGRCASSTHEGHSSCRVQSHCIVMGQGVGTAAALALDAGVDMAAVDVRKLQAMLKADGVYLEDVPQEAQA